MRAGRTATASARGPARGACPSRTRRPSRSRAIGREGLPERVRRRSPDAARSPPHRTVRARVRCEKVADDGAAADSLVGWLAHRLGRPKRWRRARALGRLRHVLEHWLTDGERTRLLAWLSRRVALGE